MWRQQELFCSISPDRTCTAVLDLIAHKTEQSVGLFAAWIPSGKKPNGRFKTLYLARKRDVLV